jgi:hypothetical protein
MLTLGSNKKVSLAITQEFGYGINAIDCALVLPQKNSTALNAKKILFITLNL